MSNCTSFVLLLRSCALFGLLDVEGYYGKSCVVFSQAKKFTSPSYAGLIPNVSEPRLLLFFPTLECPSILPFRMSCNRRYLLPLKICPRYDVFRHFTVVKSCLSMFALTFFDIYVWCAREWSVGVLWVCEHEAEPLVKIGNLVRTSFRLLTSVIRSTYFEWIPIIFSVVGVSTLQSIEENEYLH